jgi:DeoR family transcriptional regulator, aga operon transcriptional repressor
LKQPESTRGRGSRASAQPDAATARAAPANAAGTAVAGPPLASVPVERGLLVDERRRRICDLLKEHGRVTVEELSKRFDTSVVTIRLDLATLEAAGALTRSRGGALTRRENEDLPIVIKQTLHHAEKIRIARAAAAMIKDGETIVIDSGTTTAEIAREIRALNLKSINVITNALNVALLLSDIPAVRLIVPGGVLRQESNSLSGHMAEHAIASLRADRLFLGVDGLDPEIGLMTPHFAEAQLNAKMIQISREIVAVADSSKLLRRNVSVIAKVEQLHVLITDTAAPEDVVADIRRRGVDVRLV